MSEILFWIIVIVIVFSVMACLYGALSRRYYLNKYVQWLRDETKQHKN